MTARGVAIDGWNSNHCAKRRAHAPFRAKSRVSGGSKTQCNTDDGSECYKLVGSSDEATILSSLPSRGTRRSSSASPRLAPTPLLVTCSDRPCRTYVLAARRRRYVVRTSIAKLGHRSTRAIASCGGVRPVRA
jgi:hypothetical protein